MTDAADWWLNRLNKFFIDQHGCAKNQVDAEIIASKLIDDGFEMADSYDAADFIIVNSCGFIESAKKESLEAVYSIKKAYPKKKIILAGCLAERYADTLKENLPEADGIFGNGDLLQISSFLQSVKKKKHQVLKPVQKDVCCYNRKYFSSFKNSAYVQITEGCSNHCSFCAIPVIRGELRSRPVKEVIAEIKSLLKQGFFEINLIGQDLAAYGTGKEDEAVFKKSDRSHLSLLLDEISKIKGNFWLRLLYIHPDHFSSDIIESIKKDKRILSYFDIPFQSGDTDVIKLMNRKGSKKQYEALVKKLRKELDGCVIRTTFMTGFPGETDEAFENTLDFMKTIKPDWSGCFTYSAEDDTPAKRFKDKVSKSIAKKRAAILESTQEEISQKKLSSRINRQYDVLIEEVIDGEDDNGYAIGRAWFEAPEVDGAFVVRYDTDDRKAVKSVKSGSIVKVKAVRVSGIDIDSVLV